MLTLERAHLAITGLEPVVGLDRLSVEGRHTMRFELGTRRLPCRVNDHEVWYSGLTEYRASTWSPHPPPFVRKASKLWRGPYLAFLTAFFPPLSPLSLPPAGS
jgi:hypothetical protein